MRSTTILAISATWTLAITAAVRFGDAALGPAARQRPGNGARIVAFACSAPEGDWALVFTRGPSAPLRCEVHLDAAGAPAFRSCRDGNGAELVMRHESRLETGRSRWVVEVPADRLSRCRTDGLRLRLEGARVAAVELPAHAFEIAEVLPWGGSSAPPSP